MGEELERLRKTARQLIETDRMLAGDVLAPGAPLPEPRPAPPKARGSAAKPAGPRQLGPEAGRKAAELAEIDGNEVHRCTKCQLSRGRANTVFGEGNPDAELFFIGEGPGAEEDKQGRPFVGRAGQLLTKMIQAMGLDRQDVYISNIVKCRPPGNRSPMADEVQACHDYLLRQLRIIRPKVVVALGRPATSTLLNTKEGISKLRGRWQTLPMLDPELAEMRVMPTFHPAFLLRQYTDENRAKVWSDLQEVMRELGLPTPSRPKGMR